MLGASSFVIAQNTNSRVVKAQSLMDAGKYFEADKIFDEILLTNPNKLDVLYNAAYCKLYLGRPDAAVDYLKRFLMRNKNDAEANNLLGLAYEMVGNNADAMFQFSNAIRLEKNLYEAHFNRGRIYLLMDSVELAKKDFNYAKRNKIINPELYFTTGKLYVRMRQYDSALIDLNKIIKYKSDDPNFLSLLGDMYFLTANDDTSKLEKAIEYYTRALRLDSENVILLKNRSFIYDQLDQTEKGELDKERILEIQKKSGFNPVSIKYRRLAAADNSFAISIPEEWSIFISQNNDSDVIFFFDTNFNYTQKDGFYFYDFGGQITYHPRYFEADLTDSAATFLLRYNKFLDYADKRKTFCDSFFINYRETMRKNFNSNQQMDRNLIKYTYYSKDGNKYFGVEYFCITTSGKLINIRLWLPEENSFHYELLLDYIHESLDIN